MVEWNIKAESVLEKRINIEKNQNFLSRIATACKIWSQKLQSPLSKMQFLFEIFYFFKKIE